MLKQRGGALIVLLAAFVVAGCASNQSEDLPTSQPEEVPEPTRTTPPPEPEPEAPPSFDPSSGQPFVPGTTRLLGRTFYFEYDRATLSPLDLRVLDIHATVLRNNRGRSILIEGHCDERGTREYNLALGERRSHAVRDYLIAQGVTRRQIEVVSYGEEQPEDPGHSEAAWQRNRRAVAQYR